MPDPAPHDLAVHAEFLRRLAGGLLASPDLADDAVQETLLLSLRRPPAPSAAPRAWLAGLLRNVVRNLRRGARRRAARERAVAVSVKVAASGPAAIRERERLRRRLIEAVLTLPEPLREVVLLRYDQGLPAREVARVTGRPVATVHDRLGRALVLLRQRLDVDVVPGDAGERRGSTRAALAALVDALPRPLPHALSWGGVLMTKKLALVGALLLLVGASARWLARGPLGDDPPPADATAPLEGRGGSAASEPAAGPVLAGTERAHRPASTRAQPAVFGLVQEARTGRAVARARIVACSLEPSGPPAEAISDGEGRFELATPPGGRAALHVVVEHPDFAPHALERVMPALEPLHVRLEPASFIVGRLDVPTPGHAGFATARVQARARPPQREGELLDVLRLDLRQTLPPRARGGVEAAVQDGAFRLGPLAAGRYAVALVCEGLAPLELTGAASHERASGLEVPQGATVDMGRLRVPDLRRVTLRVLDAATEAPVRGVSLAGRLEMDRSELLAPLEAVPVEPPGTYELPCFGASDVAQTSSLRVSAPGYGPILCPWVNHFDDGPHVVRLHAAAGLEGSVADEEGRPLVGVLVLVRTAVDEIVRAWGATDAQGGWSFVGLPAVQDLHVLALVPGADDVHAMAVVRLAPGATARVDLGGTGSTGIVGTVARAGRPVVGALVSLDGPDGRRMQVQTRAAGRFAFAGLDPGVQSVFVGLGGVEGSVEILREVRRGETARVALDLAPPVAGRVALRTLAGAPAERASGSDPLQVTARGTGPAGLSWTVRAPVAGGSQGAFLLSLPSAPGPAAWTLSVEEDEALTLEPTILTLPRGDDAPPLVVPVTLDPRDGTYEIAVLDAESGAPVPEASFTGGWRTTQAAGTLADDGILRETAAGLADYAFWIHAPRHVSAEVRFQLTPRERHVRRDVRLARADAVRIVGVEAPGAAADAGVREGDLLIRHGARPVARVEDLAAAVAATAPAVSVDLELLRHGSPLTLRARGGRLGVRVENARREPR